jgi:hypothetical protein
MEANNARPSNHLANGYVLIAGSNYCRYRE